MTDKFDLNTEIMPGRGTETLTLGMPIRDLLADISALGRKHVKVRAYFPGTFEYEINEGLCLFINVADGTLVRVDFFGAFSGKTSTGIGIGESGAALRAQFDDLTFDETYVLVGDGDQMIIALDGDEDIQQIDTIDERRIERITVETKDWRNSE